jgi:spermidine synthase
VEIVMGDARLTMEREPPQQYDVLALDAFSGDAIPVHLLTREAFELYFRHLKPDGVLAVHVSNKYLELEPVVERIAREMGKPARIVESRERPEIGVHGANWVTEQPGFFERGLLPEAARPIPPRPNMPVWTDAYSNLLQIIAVRE